MKKEACLWSDHRKAVIVSVTDREETSLIRSDMGKHIAALWLTTEALISEIKEDRKSPAMPQGGGMGDMY